MIYIILLIKFGGFFMDLFDEIKIAKNARNYSYAPYTNYFVGSALKTKSR